VIFYEFSKVLDLFKINLRIFLHTMPSDLSPETLHVFGVHNRALTGGGELTGGEGRLEQGNTRHRAG
jgi:hypothetical protein